MAEDPEEGGEEGGEGAAEEGGGSKSKLKLIIIVAGIAVLLVVGGFLAYKMLFSGKKDDKGAKHSEKAAQKEEEVVEKKIEGQGFKWELKPFIANLTDKGRYVKLTVVLEVIDKKYEPKKEEKEAKTKEPNPLTEKEDNIRDAIIILLSSKSSETLSTIEGKLQLKDEILLRCNQVMEKEIFTNVYFTDFVMQ